MDISFHMVTKTSFASVNSIIDIQRECREGTCCIPRYRNTFSDRLVDKPVRPDRQDRIESSEGVTLKPLQPKMAENLVNILDKKMNNKMSEN